MSKHHYLNSQDQIMDYASTMVVSMDFTGDILYANPSFICTLGYDKNEASNIIFENLLHRDDKNLWSHIFTSAKEGYDIESKEIIFLTKHGEPLIMKGSFHLLKDEEDGYFGFTIMLKLKAVLDKNLGFEVNSFKSMKKNLSNAENADLMTGSLFTQLEDQESPMNRFLDSLNDLVFFKDINGVYRGCNQVFSGLLNHNKDEILGKNDFDLYPEDIAHEFIEMDKRVFLDSIPRKTENWVTNDEGQRTYLETIKTLYLDDKENVLGYLGISRDLTDRKKAEKTIAENEVWLNIYFNQSLSGKFFMMLSEPIKIDLKTTLTITNIKKLIDDVKVMRINESMLKLYEATENDFLGKNPNQLPFFDTVEIINILPELLEQGYLHHLAKARKFDGSEIWISGDYSCLYNDEGLLFGFYGNHVNVTKDVEIEEEAKVRERYLQKIIETTRDGYYAVDINYNIIDVNDAYCHMSGYTKEELLRMSVKDLISLEFTGSFMDQTNIIMADGSGLFESRHARKDGSVFDVEVSISAIEPPNQFFITFVRDISERKQIESFYLIEKELFKNTLLSAADAVISTDLDGNILLLNSMAESMTKWTQYEAKGKSLNDIMTIVDRKENVVKDLASIALKSDKTTILNEDYQFVNRHGDRTFVDLSASPIIGNDNTPRGVVVIFKDNTKRREIMKNYEDLSYKDSLTGVYNRRYFDEFSKKIVLESELPLTVMVVDVNSLKLTNDAFGHAVGDELLKAVAKICQGVTRQGDVVCRSGGDEFVILFPNTDRSQAKAVKDRIISKVSKTYVSSINISSAVGFSVMKDQNEYFDTVFKEADHNMYENKLRYGKDMKRKSIELLLQKLNNKYQELSVHNETVSHYAYDFAKALGMDEKKSHDLEMAGLLHDIGKIMIPPHILKKSESLPHHKSSEQIKKHVEIGYQLIKGVDDYTHLADIVLSHHECFDGTGYPRGLKGLSIPLESRMISIANAFEMMTGKRSYRYTLTKEEAITELRNHKSTQFDPELVEVFINRVINPLEI